MINQMLDTLNMSKQADSLSLPDAYADDTTDMWAWRQFLLWPPMGIKIASSTTALLLQLLWVGRLYEAVCGFECWMRWDQPKTLSSIMRSSCLEQTGSFTQWCRFLSQLVREQCSVFVALLRGFPPLSMACHAIPDSSEISIPEYYRVEQNKWG